MQNGAADKTNDDNTGTRVNTELLMTRKLTEKKRIERRIGGGRRRGRGQEIQEAKNRKRNELNNISCDEGERIGNGLHCTTCIYILYLCNE